MVSPGAPALSTRAVIKKQRRVWSERVDSWGHHGALDLAPVVAAILERTPAGPGQRILDIGSGTGTLALPLAETGATVVAVDVSAPMIDSLLVVAAERHLTGMETICVAAEELQLEPASVDTIVSNYTLHHLRDADKRRLITSARGWIRPGGRIVIGDMMFGRGSTSHDRRIIRGKVVALARKGPGGWWRVLKNVFRFLLRLRERPLPVGSWIELLSDAGFVDVSATVVLNEATVVVGMVPDSLRSEEVAAGAREPIRS